MLISSADLQYQQARNALMDVARFQEGFFPLHKDCNWPEKIKQIVITETTSTVIDHMIAGRDVHEQILM